MAEERSKVAAATAAVVPFHCIVCFDEFSLSQNRPPVVLPCGHTYVCAPCAKRLKRCMECREPLFYTLKPTPSNRTPAPPAPSMYGRYSPTTNTPSTPPYPQMPPQQISCSIPKNIVLISMMEAAERQARESYADETNGSMSACDDEEEYDLNRILAGLTTFAGPCGTYAVKEAGLVWTQDTTEHDDDNGLHVTASTDSVEISQPCTLEPGQTVQVVAWERGRAKLARNAGYVLAYPSQLVKGMCSSMVVVLFDLFCSNSRKSFCILWNSGRTSGNSLSTGRTFGYCN
jgi:Zinc finger, C3HC4 type (RING finger)